MKQNRIIKYCLISSLLIPAGAGIQADAAAKVSPKKAKTAAAKAAAKNVFGAEPFLCVLLLILISGVLISLRLERWISGVNSG